MKHNIRTGMSPSKTELSRTFRNMCTRHKVHPTTPDMHKGTRQVWALPRSLATTGGIIVIFSSSGY